MSWSHSAECFVAISSLDLPSYTVHQKRTAHMVHSHDSHIIDYRDISSPLFLNGLGDSNSSVLDGQLYVLAFFCQILLFYSGLDGSFPTFLPLTAPSVIKSALGTPWKSYFGLLLQEEMEGYRIVLEILLRQSISLSGYWKWSSVTDDHISTNKR